MKFNIEVVGYQIIQNDIRHPPHYNVWPHFENKYGGLVSIKLPHLLKKYPFSALNIP